MSANKFEFSGEVVTPLFMGGSDARQNPELRSPSLRGALRYWFRALLGGCESIPLTIETLKNEEQRVFGSPDTGSAVAVTLHGEWDDQILTYQKDRALRTPNGDYSPTGKDYLLWSMAESGRQGTPRYLPSREYIKPGSKFAITLRTRLNQEMLKRAYIALWLLSNFGAIGARANRGAGSFQITSFRTDDLPDFKLCESTDELYNHLKNGITQCLQLLGGQDAIWRNFNDEQPPFDILSPSSAEIWIISDAQAGWSSHLDSLNGIGETLRNYRSHSRPNSVGKADHDAVLKWLEKGGTPPNIQRAAFGLPIPFRYSEGGPNDVIQSEIGDRRSSPLKIRITRLTTGKYVGILVLFKSQFLEERVDLQLQTRKWTAPPPADYSVIQQFINSFPVKKSVMP